MQAENQYLDYLNDWSFQGINGIFDLSYLWKKYAWNKLYQ